MTFIQKLQKAVNDSNSTLCVGLDPNPALFPESVKQRFKSLEEQFIYFCKLVIDYTSASCAAYKPNLAFFEALGTHGLEVLQEVIHHIPQGKIVIADAKRGDLPSTADQYKVAFFERFNVDAVTLNPLMGFETLQAFSEDPGKGMYVLTLTSNPGADDFLKKPFQGFDMMSQYIAQKLSTFPSEAHTGMVIGATQSDTLTSVIKHYPKAALLIPGIGAQGGSVEELEKALKNHRGMPLINSSRSIIFAGGNEENWAELVEHQAIKTKNLLASITHQYVQT